MAKKNILLINGHPREGSFCDGLCEAYGKGLAVSGVAFRVVHLRNLNFNPLMPGYDASQVLEPDLRALQQDIAWADHLTIVYPLWWGGMPGLVKSALERVLLPGFAFRYTSRYLPPRKLLKGKTARLIVTMDSPPPVYRRVFGAPGHRQLKNVILGFCGIKTLGIHDIGPVKLAPAALRTLWLARARALGRAESSTVGRRVMAPWYIAAALTKPS